MAGRTKASVNKLLRYVDGREMKYITSVINKPDSRIEHIIDCGNGNVTVIEKSEVSLGSEHSKFITFGIIVDVNLSVNTSHRCAHLAQIVLAVEQVRFVLQSTGRKIGGEAA